jgi:hypothetical protein
MFIRVDNTSNESVVDIRVTRNDTNVFEERFEIPAFEGAESGEEHEAKFHDRPHMILIEDEWDTSPASFEVGYRNAGGEWEQQNCSESEKEIVGLTVDILGFGTSNPGISARIHEFESTDQVEMLLAE